MQVHHASAQPQKRDACTLLCRRARLRLTKKLSPVSGTIRNAQRFARETLGPCHTPTLGRPVVHMSCYRTSLVNVNVVVPIITSFFQENNLGLFPKELHDLPGLDALDDGDFLLDTVPLEVKRRLLTELGPRHSIQDLSGSVRKERFHGGGGEESSGGWGQECQVPTAKAAGKYRVRTRSYGFSNQTKNSFVGF